MQESEFSCKKRSKFVIKVHTVVVDLNYLDYVLAWISRRSYVYYVPNLTFFHWNESLSVRGFSSVVSGDLAQWYKRRASDRKVTGSTPSSGDFFTLRQGDLLTLLLGWIAEGYCMEVWARSAEKSAAKRLGRLYESGLVWLNRSYNRGNNNCKVLWYDVDITIINILLLLLLLLLRKSENQMWKHSLYPLSTETHFWWFPFISA